jgi:regulator of G-protein signaling
MFSAVENEDFSAFADIEVSLLSAGNWFGEATLAESSDDEEDLDEEEDLEDAKGDAEVDKAPRESTTLSMLFRGTPPPPGDKTTELKARASQSKKTFMHGMVHTASDKDVLPKLKAKKSGRKLDRRKKKVQLKGSRPAFRVVSDTCVIFEVDKRGCELFFEDVPEARQWFDVILARYSITLDAILKIPKAAAAFSLFLESEYAEENLHFVLAVNEYKAAFRLMSLPARLETASIMCDMFVSPDAIQQVNLSGFQRRKLLKGVKKGVPEEITIDMFDNALKSIYLLLERDCFPRFKQSRHFQEFLEGVENFTQGTKEEYLIKQEKEKEERELQRQSSTHRMSVIHPSSVAKMKELKSARTMDWTMPDGATRTGRSRSKSHI